MTDVSVISLLNTATTSVDADSKWDALIESSPAPISNYLTAVRSAIDNVVGPPGAWRSARRHEAWAKAQLIAHGAIKWDDTPLFGGFVHFPVAVEGPRTLTVAVAVHCDDDLLAAVTDEFGPRWREAVTTVSGSATILVYAVTTEGEAVQFYAFVPADVSLGLAPMSLELAQANATEMTYLRRPAARP